MRPQPSEVEDAVKDPQVRSGIGHAFRRAAFPTALVVFFTLLWAIEYRLPEPPLNTRDFGNLVAHLSEPPGYFDTNNLISNEDSFQHVVPELRAHVSKGGVYLGVGPDQNFTYMAHTRPRLAFLIDIRRDNQLLLLYYKALFHQAKNRSEFLSLLLGRPLQGSYQEAEGATVEDLVIFFEQQQYDESFFHKAFQKSWERTVELSPGILTPDHRNKVLRLAEPFGQEGLSLKFRSHGRRARTRYPTLRDLLLECDRDGNRWHYLNTDADYQFLRLMQMENWVIPIVGDVSGPRALNRIADYLEAADLQVTAFYISNVEYYLFRQDDFSRYVQNLARLPAHPSAVMIRSHFGYGFRHPANVPGYAVTSLLHSLPGLVESHRRSPYLDYWDLLLRDALVPE